MARISADAAILGLRIGDRVGAVRIGPDATNPPSFGLGDGVASGFEILLVVACITAFSRGRRRQLVRRTNVVLTLSTIALTTLGFLSVLGLASTVLPRAM